MSKKAVKLLSMLVVAVLLFGIAMVGCGGNKEEVKKEGTTQQAQTAEKNKEGAKKEPVTITYSTFRYEDEVIFKTLIEKFQKENPGITVKFDTNKDTSAYYQTLKANIQSGSASDVFDVHPSLDYVNYAKEGIIVDLSDLGFIKNYTEGAKAITTIDGKIYGYNHAVNMILCIYNKEIFAKHGVDVPKDWNDFVAIVNKLKAGGEGGVAYCGADVRAQWLTNALLIQEMGAGGYSKFFVGIDKGEITAIKDNAQVYTALKTLGEFNRNKILYDNSDSVKYPQSLSLFAQKKAPIIIMGTWTFGTRDNDYPGIDIGIFAIPTLDKTDVAYAEPAQISVVYAKSKNIDAAKKWVDFLAAPENASIYISSAKMTPTIKGVKADFPSAELISAQMEKGVNVLPIVSRPKAEFYDPAWNAMIENILFKGADVDKEIAAFEEALKKADLKNKK